MILSPFLGIISGDSHRMVLACAYCSGRPGDLEIFLHLPSIFAALGFLSEQSAKTLGENAGQKLFFVQH